MKIICWNCRGLGNPQSVNSLGLMLRQQVPNLVFLIETRMYNGEVMALRSKWGMRNVIGVDCGENRSGGLALLWSENITVSLQSFSKGHIDVLVEEAEISIKWRFTGFYGHPETHLRKQSWELLKLLHSQMNFPWLVAGDFNEILSEDEKLGGNSRLQGQMTGFREALDACWLKDLGYVGNKFTWVRSKYNSVVTQARLDRAIASQEWCELMKVKEIRHLTASVSDHCPILICCSDGDIKRVNSAGKRRWHFEEMWLRHPNCKEVIKDS